VRVIRFSSVWLLRATGMGPQGFHQDFLQQLDEIQTKTMTLCASDSGEALHVAARAGRAIGERGLAARRRLELCERDVLGSSGARGCVVGPRSGTLGGLDD